MTFISSELTIFERRLSEAARAFSRRILEPSSEAEDERAMEATLLRFGFALADVATISASAEQARLEAMEKALAREFDHHRRAARARRFGYDLNRHITVVRAIRCFSAKAGRAPIRP